MLSRAENLRKQHRHLARSWLPQNVMNGCDQGHISCIALPMSAKHTDAHTPIQSGAPAAALHSQKHT